ncbi:MAG TPA: hypothetical protein VNW54_12560, partial [Granulicella sp.]|nr:hypothetical protein [Granulicella sp.]
TELDSVMHRVQHTAKLGERMDLPGRTRWKTRKSVMGEAVTLPSLSAFQGASGESDQRNLLRTHFGPTARIQSLDLLVWMA